MEELSGRHYHPHKNQSEDFESGDEDVNDSDPLVQYLLGDLDILQETIYVVLLDALGQETSLPGKVLSVFARSEKKKEKGCQ